MMDEAKLLQKLERIEALHAGATTEGERVAAANACERIQARLEELQRTSPPVEYRFTMNNSWSRTLFVALLRRYDLKPYRYRRQRHNTVMVRVTKAFVDDVLWPQFVELDTTLRGYLEDVTTRVIKRVVHHDASEVDEVEEPRQLAG